MTGYFYSALKLIPIYISLPFRKSGFGRCTSFSSVQFSKTLRRNAEFLDTPINYTRRRTCTALLGAEMHFTSNLDGFLEQLVPDCMLGHKRPFSRLL